MTQPAFVPPPDEPSRDPRSVTPPEGIATTRLATPQARKVALRRVNAGGARWFWEWTRTFTVAVFLFLFVRAFLVEAFKIPSGSMERTLLVGDFLLVNKLVYGAEVPFTGLRLPALRAPRRGDVIVFQYPRELDKNFVKRLVGLPGDTLAMRDGLLYLNNVLQKEGYVQHTEPETDPADEAFRWQSDHLVRTAAALSGEHHPSRNNWGPLIVPDGNYFVLGDNRDNSSDSRYWGFVPDTLVRGQPLFVYYSYAPDSADTFAWLTRVRWARLGTRVR
jgi:signal peptidase I